VYVNDIAIAGNGDAKIPLLKDIYAAIFQTRDLGCLKEFFGGLKSLNQWKGLLFPHGSTFGCHGRDKLD